MPHAIDREQVDTGACALALLARLNGIVADPQLLHDRFSRGNEPLGGESLRLAADSLGLKSALLKSDWQRLRDNTPFPALAEHVDGHWFVIAAVGDGRVLLHDPLEQRPVQVVREVFEQLWSGRLMLLSVKGSRPGSSREFGFSWFVPAMLKYRSLLLQVLVASCFLQLLALTTPLFFQVVMDKVLVHQGFRTLDVMAFAMFVVALFEALLGGLRTYLFSHTTNRIDVELGARLYHHLLALPLSYFEARRIGDSVARVRELDRIREFITGSALTLLIDLGFTLIFIAIMYYYSPLLTWIVVASIPCYLLLSLAVTPVLRRRLDDRFSRGAENQAFLVESVSGIRTLKSLAVEHRMQRRWEDRLAAYVTADFRCRNLGNIAQQSAGFINRLMMLGILWQGAHLVIGGSLSLGQFIAFNLFAQRVSGPVLKIVQLWQEYQQAGISMRRMGDILNAQRESAVDEQRSSLPAIKGEIVFDQVRFRYRSDTSEVLAGLSLKIEQGEVVGIVGPSGCGKSTLAKLIQRLYAPEAGRVLVDGYDLAAVDTGWIRRQIGVVLQESELFNGSVRENIALGHPAAEMERIEQVAREAGAHSFITQLARGYDTQVGEQGVSLSGGQRQRIAIARTLLGNPRILLLDEATSALDAEAESYLYSRMPDIARERTVVVISHRLSFLGCADRIFVLEKGCIIEQGKPGDLRHAGGPFARLCARQSGWIAESECAP